MTLQLRPFQETTVEWLDTHSHGFLAHEMGLGKSACAIMAAKLPALVICPAGLVVNWEREIEKWRPGTLHRSRRLYADGRPGTHSWDSPTFRIVAYSDRLLCNYSHLYETVIIDESHYVKTHTAIRSMHTCRLAYGAPRAWALSGTPVPNRPIELWPLMYTFGALEEFGENPDVNFEKFARRYANAYLDDWGNLNTRGSSNVPELRSKLEPYMIRFTKDQVLTELPPKTWRVISVRSKDLRTAGMLQEARRMEQLLAEERRILKDFDRNALQYMDEAVAMETLSELLRLHGERKVTFAANYIRDALASAGPASQVVVFAYHRSVIAELEKKLAQIDFNGRAPLGLRGVVTIHGGKSKAERSEAEDRFQDPNDPARVLVGQVTAAGVGLTLTAASHVIFVEGSWVPGVLDQAADRCHRIGQTDNVTADVLTVHRSIDEHQLRRALDKLENIRALVPVTELR